MTDARLPCAFECGATFPSTVEGELQLFEHEALHALQEDEADLRQAREDREGYEGP